MGLLATNKCRHAAWWTRLAIVICTGSWSAPSWAVEGATAAGPIGGSDIRSAMLPPPGFYGGVFGFYGDATGFNDGSGHPDPALNAFGLQDYVGGALFVYVPDLKLFGGQIGFAGFEAAGQYCGQLVSAVAHRCVAGFGDPYFEADWSRSFGQVRPPSTAGAFPIIQGLVLDFGIGAVLPIGTYNQQIQSMNGATPGSNTFDLAPSVAVTYTTPPLIAEGTEFSARLYWNNYATNPATEYHASSRPQDSVNAALSPQSSAAARFKKPTLDQGDAAALRNFLSSRRQTN